MKRFFWNLRYALYIKRVTCWRWSLCWESVVNCDDSFENRLTPKEAVYEDFRD